MAKRVLMAEVSRGRVQERPRLGWMDGLHVALGNRGMPVEAVRQCAKIRKSGEPRHIIYVTEWVSRGYFCLTLCSLPCRDGRHLERSEIPLHDAVGMNCKKGASVENQGTDIKYKLHDYPLLVEVESYGILLFVAFQWCNHEALFTFGSTCVWNINIFAWDSNVLVSLMKHMSCAFAVNNIF